MKERDWGHSNNCGNLIKYMAYTLYVIFGIFKNSYIFHRRCIQSSR